MENKTSIYKMIDWLQSTCLPFNNSPKMYDIILEQSKFLERREQENNKNLLMALKNVLTPEVRNLLVDKCPDTLHQVFVAIDESEEVK